MALRISLSTSGLFVSAIGKSALSSTLTDLLINGTNIASRIFLAGTFSYGTESGSMYSINDLTYYKYSHGLGYIPVFNLNYALEPSHNPYGFFVDTNYYYSFVSGIGDTQYYQIFYDRWV